MTIYFDQSDLLDLAKGACFLGSGGGGNYSDGARLASHFLVEHGYYPKERVAVASLDEVAPDEWGVVVAYLGAPDAVKSATHPQAAINAVKHLAKHLEKKDKSLKYLIPVELGALNSVVACLAAAKLGLTVIDADGAGRAVPKMGMTTFADAGVPVAPARLAADDDFCIDVSLDLHGGRCPKIARSTVMEDVANSLVQLPEFQQIGGLAVWPMNGRTMRSAIRSKGSLTFARDLGRTIAGGSLDETIRFLEGRGKQVCRLFRGRFDAAGCGNLTSGAFDHSRLTVKDDERQLVILAQNESMLAWRSDDSRPAAMAPDSIALFVHDAQKAYAVGDLMPGAQLIDAVLETPVTVLGIAAEHYLCSSGPCGLLQAFMSTVKDLGYLGAYAPIQNLEAPCHE